MQFARVVSKRLFFLVFVVAGVSLITFTVSHLIPGDPARLIAGDRASAETVEAMREQLGLNRPLPEQYAIYVSDLFKGDLGTSIRTGRPVLEDIKAFFPATIELGAVALLIATLIGVPFGVLSAIYRDSWIDQLCRSFAVIGISTPAFWLGLILLFVLYGELGWFPAGGRISQSLGAPPTITGFYLVDSLLEGSLPRFFSALGHIALPAITLGVVQLGIVSRQIRSAMLETMREDYVRTARANGLPAWRVVLRHGLPNALIPSVTVLGLAFGDLLYGAVLTETVFSWPGMGAYVVASIQALDFPAIMGFTVVVSIAYVLVNLVVDLVYLALDPRIREVG
ncbi:ABC transporter permease [Kaustia mangrovi]|uniref:ABC transporter permease n=1 Tax=Kaustia mangrovi TaxID=2593653 RepID=A0A7S8HD41_9HYPH|nr:ABC transporter permease [Kaustia mangrovi]QPC44099.1 ABC transporter permease [Kaustia mangrovi]